MQGTKEAENQGKGVCRDRSNPVIAPSPTRPPIGPLESLVLGWGHINWNAVRLAILRLADDTPGARCHLFATPCPLAAAVNQIQLT